MAVVTSELIWIQSFLSSLGIFLDKPMKIFCDSQAALHIAKNLAFHERTKHTELDCHLVCEKLVVGLLTLLYVTSQHQPTDLFTKPLGKKQFQYLKGKLGMGNLHASTWGWVLGIERYDIWYIIFGISCNILFPILVTFFPEPTRVRICVWVYNHVIVVQIREDKREPWHIVRRNRVCSTAEFNHSEEG